MGFVKVYKTNAYFKRYQVKYRRRREGKTDYYARKRLITQDKDKYNTPKYRFVPRLTNNKVICQIIYSTLVGDKVVCQATSSELRKWGLTAGLTNYSAAYCTGLLCARRLLKKVGMDQIYTTVSKINGEHYDPADDDKERRPFKAVLDVGLVRTTCGNRVFGALKGACDGGLHIPHSTKRFPGFSVDEDDKEQYNAKTHRERIFGVHVDKYMKELKEESDEDYQQQFAKWDECLKKNKVDSVEKLMTKIHDEIKKNPDFTNKKPMQNPKRDHKKFFPKKLTAAQKKVNVAKKFEIAMKNKR